MRSNSRATHGTETGSALILALVFVIFVGAAIAALADFVTNDISNTTHFASARNLQYAASSATNYAIDNIRYSPNLSATLNASPPGACWGGGPVSSLSNIDGVAQMDVWCSTVWVPTAAATRIVTFSACADPETAVRCAANPVLQAVVTFDDYPSGTTAPNPNACVVYCGTGITIGSWTWSPVVPAVTSVSPTTQQTTAGGTTVTINGSGFVTGATTVNFVEEAGFVPAADNTVLSATPITTTATTITVDSPAVTEGTKYFVTVTTPTGTSAYDQTGAQVFSYAPVVPTVTGISPAGGGTAGGTAVTITGSGFFSGATVHFVQSSPLISLSATDVKVTSATTITATAPGILTGQYYRVFVTNPTAGTNPASQAPLFTYQTFVPIVLAISPTSGHAGTTTITIYGANFLAGSTVNFDAVTTGGNFDNIAPAPANITPNQITVTVPALVAPDTYDVTVTAGGQPTTNKSVFTAS